MAINQLTFLGSILRDFIVPLQEDFENLESLEFLFSRYGWKISLDDVVFSLITDRSNIVLPLTEFIQTANSIEETLANNGNSTPSAPQLEELLGKAKLVFRAVAGLSISSFSGLPEPLNQELFWRDISNHILDDLLERFMRIHYSKGYLVAHLFGIIRYDLVEPENIYQRQYVKTLVDWGQALDVIKNPLHAIKKTYDWDGEEKPFDNQRLFEMLHRVLRAVGISANLVASDGKTLASIATNKPYTVNQDEDGLWIEILYDMSITDPTIFEIAIELLPAIKDTQADTSGIFIRPIVRGASETALILSSNLKLISSIATDVGDIFVAAVFPDSTEWASGQSTVNTRIELQFKPLEPTFLLGSATTTHIQILGGVVGLSMLGNAADPEIVFYAKAGSEEGKPGGKIVIPLEESDVFIKETVKKESIEFSFHAAITLSNRNGLKFNSGSFTNISLPVRIEVGNFIIEDAQIALVEKEIEDANSAIALRIGTNIKGKLGPVELAIRGMGLIGTSTNYTNEELLNLPPNKTPLFGNLDLELEFASPTGISISINSKGFKGGGLLDFEPDNQRYVGFLELEFKNKITLKALGLLTTNLPDNNEGYSLLIIITTEFTPIQLSFGFTLNGVGGLLGLNRTANVERLRTGIKDNTLSSILFPKDIVANADRIISDLRQVFPVQEGRFIFGPMAKIGWGTPTLMTIDLGLMLEVDSPVRLLILGVIQVQIPNEEERKKQEEEENKKIPRILQLQVNFLGEIDFDAQRLAFDASLYDSKILTFPLSGDMAVRFSWGTEPNFLLSIGGFNSAFQPPSTMPNLQRLTLSLLSGNNPRLRMETYFAITSNTVQFGARVELYAVKSKFNVSGFLSFDVLFQFNPFYFIADFGAMLALRVGSRSIASISLSLTLEGPTPWHAKGTAKLKICWFFTLKIRFNKTFGSVSNTRLDDILVLPLLQAALSNQGNWESQLPNERHALVSVKEINVGSNEIIVDPSGVLTINQKVVPLNITIQKFGNQHPSDAKHFAIEQVRVGALNDTELFETHDTQESFAPAQFFNKSDEQKLASKSFENYDGGIKLSQSEKITANYVVKRPVKYELYYNDTQRNQRLHRWFELVTTDLLAFKTLSSKGAVASSPLSHVNNSKSALAPSEVQVSQEQFVVVNINNLRPINEESFVASEAGAYSLMNEMALNNPALEGELQVVPTYEVNRVNTP